MRNSFLPPIPEIEQGVEHLKCAMDALLANEIEVARSFVVKADLPVISEFYMRIAGKTDPIIHYQSKQPKSLSKEIRSKIRMPSAKEELLVFRRDGWRCRFCGTRVIYRKARKIFLSTFPVETHWVSSEFKRHSTLHAQAASLDHILPHSRGGGSEELNLVTACGPCQFGRGKWTLEEVGFNNPLDRPPRIDNWNGLEELINCKITF